MRIVSFFIVVLIFTPSIALADTFQFRFRNVSPQLLTSPVCAIHTRRVSIFSLGEAASDGLKALAEDGVAGRFARELRRTRGVKAVKIGSFLSPGESGTLTISTQGGRRASCVVGMAVATNDGFPAFRGKRLPRNNGDSKRARGFVYDTGTEVNTESCDHVPGGPCNAHFVGIAENGTVQPHAGIMGDEDLNADRLGWDGAAVRVRITRTE